MNTGVLKAQDLCKSYKDKQVLHNLDLTIEPGKIYGLIGRNGAGKTTLLGILTAQNTKDSGDVTYDGQPVLGKIQQALKPHLLLPGTSAHPVSGRNNLKIKHYLKSASIYYPGWDEDYAQRLLGEFKLEPKKKIYQLSKGQMSMVTILIALASRAPVTILDEPASGLDVVMRERFYQLLLEDLPRQTEPSLSPPISSRRRPPSLSRLSFWMRAGFWRTAPPRSWWTSSAISPAGRTRWTGCAPGWRFCLSTRWAGTRRRRSGAAGSSWTLPARPMWTLLP